MNLQGCIETVRLTIASIGPATARTIEQHPDVVKACKSSKTKARRHIDRLVALNKVQWDQQKQMPLYWC